MLLGGSMSGNKLRAGLSACILYTSLACTFRGADAAPSVVHGPKIDAVTYSTARVTWITDKPSSTRIRYGISPAYTGQLSGVNNVTLHSWFISGLTPATTIHYQVCSADSTGETCSPNHVFTTLPAPAVVPAPPEPPRATVNTAMPDGAYGPPFVVDESCSNMPAIFKQLAALEGDLNYEVRIPARAECHGQYRFPNRPNHHGWVVIRPADDSKLPPPGTRVAAESTAVMPVFVTNPLPARVLHSRFVSAACFPGHLLWLVNLPGMALLECQSEPKGAETRPIDSASRAGDRLAITARNHGLATGDVIRLTGTGAPLEEFGAIVQVEDEDHFSMPALGAQEIRSGATMTTVPAWRQVRHSRGTDPPASCTLNEFFLREDGTPAGEAISWCTAPDRWTPLRVIDTSDGRLYAGVTFEQNASRYRFAGVEITHMQVPNPPPASWSNRDYKQGFVGSLITSHPSNSHIVFDRCDIHGLDYPGRLHVAANLNGSHVAIVDSRIHKVNIWTEAGGGVNLESYAIHVLEGPGPGKIENNFIEAIGISLFFTEPNGGYLHTPPADFEVRRNHFSHPDTYLYGSPQNTTGKNYMNRHLLELKRGRRMVFEGNLFDGNWADVNQGAFIMLTPRPGTNPVKNITEMRDGAITIAVSAPVVPFRPGMLVYVKDTGAANHDGLWTVDSVSENGLTIQLANGPSGSGKGGTVQAAATDVQISDIDIRSNIFRNGPQLFWATGHNDTTYGIMNTWATQRLRFENNLAYGMDSRSAAAGGRSSAVGATRDGRFSSAAFAVKGIEGLTIRHNTIYGSRGNGTAFFFTDPDGGAISTGLDVRFNVYTGGDTTVASRITSGKVGIESLNESWTTWTFTGNLFCCNPTTHMRNLTPDNNTWINSEGSIGFRNPSQIDLRLSDASSFARTRLCANQPAACPAEGREVGANLDEIEAALTGARPPATRKPDVKDTRRGGGAR
jgi:hypothetical protein